MLQAIRKAVALPRVPARWLVPSTTLLAFLWLLANDAIRPLAIYSLELFLSF